LCPTFSWFVFFIQPFIPFFGKAIVTYLTFFLNPPNAKLHKILKRESLLKLKTHFNLKNTPKHTQTFFQGGSP
jgi:hypothetical protein